MVGYGKVGVKMCNGQMSFFGKERNKERKSNVIKERVQRYGVSTLIDKEMIHFITGIRLEVLEDFESFKDLRNKIGIIGATQLQKQKLQAIYDISIRITTEKASKEAVIKCPGDAANLVMEEMRHLQNEELRIILLNTKNRVIGIKTISIGSLNESIFYLPAVLREAILNNCNSIIALHPHPSGDPTESRADIEATKRLNEACNIMGIRLLDHIIIGNDQFVSLKEKGVF